MKLLLKYPLSLDEMPYTAEVILETGTKINIDRATRDELIVDVPGEDVDDVIALFHEKGVVRYFLENQVRRGEMCSVGGMRKSMST